MKKTILVSFGTRPEAIKLYPLIQVLKPYFKLLICNTEQQKDLAQQLSTELGLTQTINLNVMTENQPLNTLCSRLLQKLDTLFIKHTIDLVIVQGDTTTAFCTALAAFHRHVPIAHIEAGLRTYSLSNPFPEEMNRKIIDELSTYRFVPTQLALNTLKNENLDTNAWVTGNTSIDTLLTTAKIVTDSYSDTLLNTLNIPLNTRYLLVTCHRRETIGSGHQKIAKALIELSKESDLHIIFITHPNPNVATTFQSISHHPNITCIPPQNYQEMVMLMKMSYLILTDSGGIQEEASALNIPVLVLRDATERMEAVHAGCSALVGTTTNTIISETKHLLSNTFDYQKMANAPSPFGDGTASKKIADIIMSIFPISSKG